MTLNGHFALKSVPCSASNGLAFWLSEKKLFGNSQSYAYTVSGKKCSPARDCTGDIRVMELFTGVTEQEASNQ